jgi:hypothetical protein
MSFVSAYFHVEGVQKFLAFHIIIMKILLNSLSRNSFIIYHYIFLNEGKCRLKQICINKNK